MIVLVAGERQAEPLDGVGDEADRAIMRARLFESLDQRRQVVAAEIGHQPRQFFVAAAFDQPGNGALVADVVEQAFAPGRSALERQGGIELVRAAVDPLPEGLAAGFGEGGFQQLAVFDQDDVPAEVPEQRLEPFPQALAHDGVEALPVVVHDPPGVAQAVLPSFQKRLEDVAFVHLGVADQRDHLAVGQLLGHALGVQVVLDERGKQRLGDAQADGAGREVDVVDILGARGVGLSPLVAAKILQLFPGLVAEQVLDRMEDRARMRLDRHPVLGTQDREIERRHDRGQRCRRRLVAANLEPVLVGTDVVGVVDRPGGQPQHLFLQCRQQLQPIFVHDAPPMQILLIIAEGPKRFRSIWAAQSK